MTNTYDNHDDEEEDDYDNDDDDNHEEAFDRSKENGRRLNSRTLLYRDLIYRRPSVCICNSNSREPCVGPSNKAQRAVLETL